MVKKMWVVKVCVGIGCVLFSLASFAQGSLEGTVVDGKTKEPLVGAVVTMEGAKATAVVGMDGKYSFRNILPGRYTFDFRYVFYNSSFQNIEIATGRVTRLDVELDESEIALRDVVVTGTRRTNTELSMLNITKTAQLEVSGISSRQIAKTLDRDAGEAIKRVPGVTIMDSRFLVVRGLSQRYNNVWLNEATVPSSESDSRAFSFDVVPGGLIDNMMVYKTPAPEIPADFSGGFVKISTKITPDDSLRSVCLVTAYQQGSTFDHFFCSPGKPADALGFGYASRALPEGFPSKITSSFSKSDLAAFSNSLNNNWGIHRFMAYPDIRFSSVFSKKFDWIKSRFGMITALNYSNTCRSYEIINNRYGIYRQDVDKPFIRNGYKDCQYLQEAKLGVLHSWLLVINPQNRMEFRNFFNQIGKSRYTEREGEDRNNDYIVHESERMYHSRSTYSGQLSGKHFFQESDTKLDWVAGYAYANRYDPDRRMVISRLNEDESSSGYGLYRIEGNDVKRYFQNLDERVVSGSLNIEKPVRISSFVSLLKAGLYGEYKSRAFSARNFVYTFNNVLLPDNAVYSDVATIVTSGNILSQGVLLKENTNKSDSYAASNRLFAAYSGWNISLSGSIHVYAGVRIEDNILRLNGYESDGIKPVTVDRRSLDVFPSLNATYCLNSKNLMRLAYGKTINRPEFREIAPYVYYDFEQFTNFEGYSGLKDARIQNVDLRYEWYPTPSETFSLGFFYKNFKNPIEITYFEVGGQQQYTYRNADRAEDIGLELDLRKNLGFLRLNDLVLVANGALIRSKVYFEKGSIERDRAMQGQSPWLLNTGLYYDSSNGWKGSLLFNRVGRRIVFVGIVNQDITEDIPDVYEMPRSSVDLSLGRKFGPFFEVNLGIKDLLNEPVAFKQFPKYKKDGKTYNREQTTKSYKPGWNVSVSVAMRF